MAQSWTDGTTKTGTDAEGGAGAVVFEIRTQVEARRTRKLSDTKQGTGAVVFESTRGVAAERRATSAGAKFRINVTQTDLGPNDTRRIGGELGLRERAGTNVRTGDATTTKLERITMSMTRRTDVTRKAAVGGTTKITAGGLTM